MNAPVINFASRLLQPGLNALPPDTERYLVKANGALVINLRAGDVIEIINPEGLQACEISVFDTRDQSDMQCIGVQANGTAEGLKKILAANNGSASNLAQILKSRNLAIDKAQSTCIFGMESLTGDSQRFTATEVLSCIVAAPGEDMGYPGHVNCSDNFNLTLQPYGVNSCRGWMAINLFLIPTSMNLTRCISTNPDRDPVTMY